MLSSFYYISKIVPRKQSYLKKKKTAPSGLPAFTSRKQARALPHTKMAAAAARSDPPRTKMAPAAGVGWGPEASSGRSAGLG